MKVERRKFRDVLQLILIPERDGEIAMLDSFFGDDSSNFEHKRILSAFLCADDTYRPYIRIETPDLDLDRK